MKARVRYSYLVAEPQLEPMQSDGFGGLLSIPVKPLSLSVAKWLIVL